MKMQRRSISWLCVICVISIGILLTMAGSSYASGSSGEYLKYEEPKPSGTSWISTTMYVIFLLLVFSLILAMAYFSSRFIGKKMGNTFQANGRVIASLPFHSKGSMYAVEFLDQYFIVGVTEQSVTLLKEITSVEEIEKLQSIYVSNESTPSFDTIFRSQLSSLHQLSKKFPSVFPQTKQSRSDISDQEKR